MNQIAAIVSPAVLSNTAGSVASATSADAQGEGFAGILAQFQSVLANEASVVGGVGGANAAVDGALNTELLQTQSVVGETPAPQITDALAASLAQIQGFLAFQGEAETPAPVAAPIGADVSIAAQVATLQSALQTAADQPPIAAQQTATASQKPATGDQSPLVAATIQEPQLRGTIPPDQSAAPAKDPAQSAKTQTQPPAQNADTALSLLAAVPSTGKQDAPANAAPVHAKAATATKRSTNAAPTDAATQVQAQPLKSYDNTQTANPAPAVAPDANAANQAGQNGAQSSVPSLPTHPVGVNSGHTLPNVIAAQQFEAAPATASLPPVPLEALAAQIARKFEGGASQFEIRLHPADLGKLDISLSVSADGQVQAAVRAERPETLELLQRDSRNLEQQLRQAGLDVGSNALSFSLSNGNNQRQSPFSGWPAFANANPDADLPADVVASKYVAVRVRDGIDISV
ncbi:MAG: flagellar hook-length control protein FliK [Alphaproteobacteria bacterium]|nr:flagellar hook-length control protein FliK [Alphaproteobacteria bacterium]